MRSARELLELLYDLDLREPNHALWSDDTPEVPRSRAVRWRRAVALSTALGLGTDPRAAVLEGEFLRAGGRPLFEAIAPSLRAIWARESAVAAARLRFEGVDDHVTFPSAFADLVRFRFLAHRLAHWHECWLAGPDAARLVIHYEARVAAAMSRELAAIDDVLAAVLDSFDRVITRERLIELGYGEEELAQLDD